MSVIQCTAGNFIYLLFFTNWIFVERTNGQYEFELEEIEYTRPTSVNEVNLRPEIIEQRLAECPLNRLSLAGELALCAQASEFAKVDEIDPQNIGVQVGVDVFGVRYPNGLDTWRIALICATTPRIHLRLKENTTNKIKIMVPRNQYMDPRYEFKDRTVGYITQIGDFEGETVDSIRRMAGTGASNLEAAGHLPYLVYRSNKERMDMCLAARKRIRNRSSPITIISEEWTEKSKKYEIQYYGIQHVAAFPCNSHPKMYIAMFEDSKTKFVVLFPPS